jgi:hypothetical protein
MSNPINVVSGINSLLESGGASDIPAILRLVSSNISNHNEWAIIDLLDVFKLLVKVSTYSTSLKQSGLCGKVLGELLVKFLRETPELVESFYGLGSAVLSLIGMMSKYGDNCTDRAGVLFERIWTGTYCIMIHCF